VAAQEAWQQQQQQPVLLLHLLPLHRMLLAPPLALLSLAALQQLCNVLLPVQVMPLLRPLSSLGLLLQALLLLLPLLLLRMVVMMLPRYHGQGLGPTPV
jgi:hypothetical protein